MKTLLSVLSLVLAAPLCAQEPFAVSRNTCLQSTDAGLHAVGHRYEAVFSERGVRFEPVLGRKAPTSQHVALRPLSLRRGDELIATFDAAARPAGGDLAVVYERGEGLRERFDVRDDGVELSWVFDARPEGAGDLVVRYACDTSLPRATQTPDGGVAFELDGVGAVTIGGVTGVDAAGRSVRGELSYDDGALELSLPAAFVDGASYPLVLDPLVGGTFAIDNVNGYFDSEPDCSYLHSTSNYFAVWLRTFAANDVRVRGQLFDLNTGYIGGTVLFNSGPIVSQPPHVATYQTEWRFGVVWIEDDIAAQTSALEFRAIDGSTGAITDSFQAMGGPEAGLADADIGCAANGPTQLEQAFVVIWRATFLGVTYARRIGYDVAGALTWHAPYPLFTDTLLTKYSQASIARQASDNARLVVVAKKDSGIGPAQGVVGVRISAGDSSVTPAFSAFTGVGVEVQTPAVDGWDNTWIVSWRQNNVGSAFHRVAACSVSYTGPTTVAFGPVVGAGGSALSQAERPSVAYTPGKTWLGMRYSSFGSTSLQVRGVDSVSCASCGDTFSEPLSTSESRIVVATSLSSGELFVDDHIVVWGENDDIWGHRIRNHDGGGTIANIGGGCGNGGAQDFGGSPSTGQSLFRCRVFNLPPTALATVFNFSPTTFPLPCGSCSWLPFSFTEVFAVPPIGAVYIDFPIPCAPGLVGLQFETQWTTLDPSQAPCVFFPQLALSDRALLTIGD